MPIALNDSFDEILISPAYAVFEVIDETIILTEYLMLWFKRSEFDRYADFRCDAAIRGGYGWNELCDTDIFVPNIAIQQKIVKQYKVISDRIMLKQQINDNLEAQAGHIFNDQIKTSTQESVIGSFGDVITGKTPPTSNSEYYGNDIPFIKTPDMHNSVYVTTSQCSLSILGAESQSNKYIPENSVIVACIGANAGEVSLTSYLAQTNQQINSVITKYPCFLYYSIKAHKDELRALGDGSSTMLNINKSSFENYGIPTLDEEDLLKLEYNLSGYFNLILANLREIDKLINMKSLMISRLSR